jgi:TolB-like protein
MVLPWPARTSLERQRCYDGAASAARGGTQPIHGSPTLGAVLPFVNMNKDPANDYFSDGLAETTLDMLAQVPNLKIVARVIVFVQGQVRRVRKIARRGAATLLEGGVQRAGDAVRITAQLVKTSDGTLVVEAFRSPARRCVQDQDEVATEVVRALKCVAGGDQQRLTQKRTRMSRRTRSISEASR